MLMPVADLLRMKLTAFRDKARVHVRLLDSERLITQNVEASFIPGLAARLQ